MDGIHPINLHTEQMAQALGFSTSWLVYHRDVLQRMGAMVHDGRWHVSTTENAFLEACKRGLLGRTNPDGKTAARGRAASSTTRPQKPECPAATDAA